MKDVFNQILDKDEQLIELFKPNKFKYFFSCIMWAIICSIFLVVPFFIGEEISNTMILSCVIVICIYLIIWILFSVLKYKETFYGYTNKRVVIRTGIIGVDYKSLDMKMIGAIDVYVSFLDKILCQNTGTIKFGSMSSPINNQNSTYVFSNIKQPYELYKQIKEVIDNRKENKNEN